MFHALKHGLVWVAFDGKVKRYFIIVCMGTRGVVVLCWFYIINLGHTRSLGPIVMRTSCYLNTAVGLNLHWLIMPLIGNTVRREPLGYCSEFKAFAMQWLHLGTENIPSKQALLFVLYSLCCVNQQCSSKSIVYACLRHLQSAVSKSNVNVELLQTYANAGKKLMCEGKGGKLK